MSRHRDVRNMDYSDDYDGYDDVYGHSVDDDYYISPSHRQFMYNRENSGQSKSAESYPMEQDIQEEDEDSEESKLCDVDKAKLESCLEHIKSTLAPINMSRQELVKIIVDNKFDSEKIINSILNTQKTLPEKRDKDVTSLYFSLTNSQKESNSCNELFKKPSLAQFNNKNISSPVSFMSKLKEGNPNSFSSAKITPKSLNLSFSPPIKTNNDEHESIISPKTSFLSKIKNMPCNSSNTDQPVNSFLSKINRSDNIARENIDFTSLKQSPRSSEMNMPEMKNTNVHSFLSKIKKPTDSSHEHSSDSTLNKQCLSFKLKDNENSLESITNKFHKKMNLSMQNEASVSNGFLSKIKNKEVLEPMSVDVADDLSKLKIKGIKSSPQLTNTQNFNDFNIDLTKALRGNNSENLKVKNISSEEKFEIPFIACDHDIKLEETNKKLLTCIEDISYLATKKLSFERRKPSRLGEILCLKYKIPKMKNFGVKKLKIVSMFDFSTPCPDEEISKHLKRNL